MILKRDEAIEKFILVLSTILLSTFSIGRMNIYSSYFMIIITGVVTLLHAYNNKGKIKLFFRKMQIFVGLFALYCFLSAIWAINSMYAIEKGVTIFEILICVSVFYWTFSTFSNPIYKVLKVIMWSGYIVMAYSFLSAGILHVLRVLITRGRLDSTFDNVNMISFVCVISIIINVFFAIYEKLHIYDILLLFSTIILVAGCGSRKSLLILVIGILLVYVFKIMSEGLTLKGLKYVLLMILALISFAVAASSAYFSGIMGRMEGLIAAITGTGTVDHSTWLRQQMILLGLAIFQKHPIGGIGIGCPRILAYSTFGTNSYLHNNYAELLAGGGALGFVIYYAPYIYLLIQLWKNRKLKFFQETHIILIIYFCMFVADYGMVSYYSKLHYFLMVVGFMCVDYMKESCYV